MLPESYLTGPGRSKCVIRLENVRLHAIEGAKALSVTVLLVGLDDF